MCSQRHKKTCYGKTKGRAEPTSDRAVNNYASVYNYVPPAAQKKPATAKPRAELNLRQINENKATTTGMVGRGSPSGSGGNLTAEQWGKMSLAEQYEEMGKRNLTFNDVAKLIT